MAPTRAAKRPNVFVRAMVKRPCIFLVLSLLLAIGISAVGMVVGEFAVSADNDGWESRNTAVADKAAQDDARLNLWARTRGHEEEYRRRRRLAQTTDYNLPHDVYQLDLFSIYRAKGDHENLLQLDVLKDMCAYEEKVLAETQRAGLCREHYATGCLKPVSWLTLLREYMYIVYDPDATHKSWMTCDQLFSVAKQSDVDSLADKYVEEAMAEEGQDMEEVIPSVFMNNMVGIDLLNGGKNQTVTLVSYFPLLRREEEPEDRIYALHEEDGFKFDSPYFEVVYETVDQALQDKYVDEVLQSDMIMACAATAIILALIWFHTRSIFLAFIGVVQVGLSFPAAYFAYKMVFGLEFFPFLNFLAMFVVMGIGADDIFVLHDKFEQAAQVMPGASVYDIACKAIPEASYAMLLTSATTAGAFFSTAITPVAPIRMFAIFLGTMTFFDYIFVIMICAPAMVAQLYWVDAAVKRGPHLGRRLKFSLLDYSKNACCRKKSKEQQKETLAQSVLVKAAKGTIALRYVLVPGLLALFAYFTMVALDIPMPKTSEVQLLADSHPFTKWSKWKNDLYSKDGGETSWVNVIWGLTPGDTGNFNNPASKSEVLLDSTFSIYSEESQVWLLDFCEETSNQTFATGRADCTIKKFENWVKTQWNDATGARYTGLPLPPDTFRSLMLEWRTRMHEYIQKRIGITSEYERGQEILRNEIANRDEYFNYNGDVMVPSDQILYFVMCFEATVKWNDPYNKLKSQFYEWSSYIETKMGQAPEGLTTGFFNSADFHWWDTNKQMKDSAYMSALLSVAIACAVIFISNGNVILTLYSVVAIFCILVTVASTAVAMGWELGFLEAICFAILVGLSCDFIVHIAHAYKESDAETRRQKALDAVWAMGPPVLFAAVSTSLSGALLFSCNILFYIKFGAILMLTMAYSFTMIFVFLVPLLALAGPTGNWGDVFALCRKTKGEKSVA